MVFEEGGIIEIIQSCLKMIFKEGGIIEIISTFVYFMKPKRCDRIDFNIKYTFIPFYRTNTCIEVCNGGGLRNNILWVIFVLYRIWGGGHFLVNCLKKCF